MEEGGAHTERKCSSALLLLLSNCRNNRIVITPFAFLVCVMATLHERPGRYTIVLLRIPSQPDTPRTTKNNNAHVVFHLLRFDAAR